MLRSLSIVKNCNHKRLGIYYLLAAVLFGLSGIIISVFIRIELFSSANRIMASENQNFYNLSLTLHGLLMIFFLVMPGLFGFGNYFLPLFLGSPEVLYPRVNNYSISILFLSFLLVVVSFLSDLGGGTGWTLYPPHSLHMNCAVLRDIVCFILIFRHLNFSFGRNLTEFILKLRNRQRPVRR